MFLSKLNEQEKQAFLGLAHHLARSDGDFSDKQKALIHAYCVEMETEDIKFDESKFNLSDTLSCVISPISQRIFLFELMALVYSDDYMHPDERAVLDDVIDEFNLDPKLIGIYAYWTKAMLALSLQGELLLEI